MAKTPKGAAPKSRDETLDLPDWLLLFDGGDIKEFLAKLRHTFRRVYIVMMVALLFFIPVSIALNGTEARWLNLIPIALMTAFAVYHAFEPYKFLAWFGFGAVSYGGIPNARIMEVLKLKFPDFELTKFLRAGGQGVKFGWDILAVTWLFFFMWFMVFATVRVEPGPAYFFLFVLMAWGAISIKWPATAPWYKRICMTVTLVFTGLFLYQGLIAKTDWWRELQGANIEVQHIVVSTDPQPLTAFHDRTGNGRMEEGERRIKRVPNGCYSFTATGPDTMFEGLNQADNLGDIVLLNGFGEGPDWVFPVTDNQVTVSFVQGLGQRAIAGGGYEVMKITLIPAQCPSEEEQ
jgi:hypothetical protein